MEKLRTVDLSELKQLGWGTTAEVYAISDQQVLKVYHPYITREAIEHECEVTRRVGRAGIRCAQPLEMVRADGKDGVIFERVSPDNIAKDMIGALNAGDEETLKRYVDYYVAFAHHLHQIELPEGTFRDIREYYADRLRNWPLVPLTDETKEELARIVLSFPKSGHYLHGDMNPMNVPPGGFDKPLYDVGDASQGESIFDFAQLACAYIYLDPLIPGSSMKLFGVTPEKTKYLNEMILDAYYTPKSDAERKLLMKKLTIVTVIYGVVMNIGEGDFLVQIRERAEKIAKEAIDTWKEETKA